MTDEPIPTDLVTAAVNLPSPEPPPSAALPSGWTIHKVFELVNEVAQNLYDPPYYLKKYKLTEEQYAKLAENEYFQKALARSIEDWQRPNNVNQRLALESAVGIESALPTVIARLSKTDEPLPGIVQLLKVLSELAGATGNRDRAPDASGEKFKIVINLGADTFQAEKTAPGLTIQSFPEGPSPDAEIQRLTSKA